MRLRYWYIVICVAILLAVGQGIWTWYQRPRRLTLEQLLELPVEQLLEVRIACNASPANPACKS
ncbi:MAG: hypothetical protein QHH07_01550 [Sedimentisphaerales bacterium]|nr:hypothetical protein [Sedimentisphaerales bacterium]